MFMILISSSYRAICTSLDLLLARVLLGSDFPIENFLLAHRATSLLEQPLLDAVNMEEVLAWKLDNLLSLFYVVVAN